MRTSPPVKAFERLSTHGVQLICVLVLVPKVFGASFTYHVTEHSEACREVHIPRWTMSPEMKKEKLLRNDSLALRTGDCSYDLRTRGGTIIYVSVSCLSGHIRHPWLVAEKYEVDTSRPQNVQEIDESAWQAAANSEKLVRRPGNLSDVTNDGKEFRGRFFKKSGPKWPEYGEGPYESFDNTRIVLDSWDGVIAFLGPFEWGRDRIIGQYWTDIYGVRSGQRLIQIQGTFHGIQPNYFQLQASLLGEKFYILPLQPKGMRRLLVCDLDIAERATSPSR